MDGQYDFKTVKKARSADGTSYSQTKNEIRCHILHREKIRLD